MSVVYTVELITNELLLYRPIGFCHSDKLITSPKLIVEARFQLVVRHLNLCKLFVLTIVKDILYEVKSIQIRLAIESLIFGAVQ